MLNNCRSLAEDRKRQLASSLLGMVKGEKNVASVTSGQLRRLLGTVWKHPQCWKANSNCILSGASLQELKNITGQMTGPCISVVTSPLLWLDNCPTASLLYCLGLLCCERCKDQAVQEQISGIQVIIILIFLKNHSKSVQISCGASLSVKQICTIATGFIMPYGHN